MQVNRRSIPVSPCTRPVHTGFQGASLRRRPSEIRAFKPSFLGQSFFGDLPREYQIAVHGGNAEVRQANAIFDQLTKSKIQNPSIKELSLGSTRPFYVTIYPGVRINNNEELRKFLNEYLEFKNNHYVHGKGNHAYIGMKDGKIHLSTMPLTPVSSGATSTASPQGPRPASPAQATSTASPAQAPRPASPAAPRIASPAQTTSTASPAQATSTASSPAVNASVNAPAPHQIINSVKSAWTSFTGLFASKPVVPHHSAGTWNDERWEERLFESEPSPLGQKMQDGDWWSKATGDLAKLVQGGEVKASVVNSKIPDGDRHVPTAGTLAKPNLTAEKVNLHSLSQFEIEVNRFPYFNETQKRSFKIMIDMTKKELATNSNSYTQNSFALMNLLEAELKKVIKQNSKDPVKENRCIEFFKSMESQMVPNCKNNPLWDTFRNTNNIQMDTSPARRRSIGGS